VSKPIKPKQRHFVEQLRCGLQGVAQWLVAVDCVLRPGGESSPSMPTRLLVRQVAITVVVFGPLYGMAMGSFAWMTGEREFFIQLPLMIFSGIKVPLLLAVTVAISLPSFFVINTLFGLRDDFREVLLAIVSAQAGLAIILASLLPLTLFVYICVMPRALGYKTAVLFNALMFGLASVASQALLAAYYRPLCKSNPRHATMMKVWIFVYAFVGIQAGYCLRPFIGSPDQEVGFLRDGPFENAYVKVWQMFIDVADHWLAI
jgi:hypothetical protein